MGSFGQDLRMERVSRGIALESISAETKIGQRHLEALETDRFRMLPGGILGKGIVRSYASFLGLDQNEWTSRYLSSYSASGAAIQETDWSAFASNVGRARLQRNESRELRMRWLGAGLLLVVTAVTAFITYRYYGMKLGWWDSLVPARLSELSRHAVTQLTAKL